MAADPYADFQKPATPAANPYAEFQQPAQAAPVAPTTPESHPIRDFIGNAVSALNPIPAIKEWANRPSEFAKIGDGIAAYGEAGDKPLTPEQERRLDAGMNANVPTAEGNILGESMAPAVKGGLQIKHGDVAGGLGTVAGGYAPFVAAPALTKGLGNLVKAPAGPIAETAMGIRKLDRTYGKTPGQAILDETTGIRPGTIAQSAKARLRDLDTDLESRAAGSNEPASLAPARKVLDGATQEANNRNSSQTLGQIAPMRSHLTTNVATGLPLAESQTPLGILNLKRGFADDFIHNWNPEISNGVRATAKNAYRALDGELDRTVSGADQLNQRISSLIPVKNRAASVDRNAGPLQQSLARFAHPTGALASGLAGAFEGGQHFGPLGAVTGAIGGLGIPQLIASPTAQMIAARALDGAGKTIASPLAGDALRFGPLVKPRRKEKESQ